MYTVTFYSFKGGVGRSMALMNVGAQLASSGKRVLLVDFDLEAPGLPTFSLCKSENEVPGMVDFVTDFINSGETPAVEDYVYKSHEFETGGEIWVMPVGRQDANYSNRLNSINWQDLYAKKNGFLLFEDLKLQWRETIRPDYVLIDSRTGHSDVEGICTRQLPDSLALLFFPNEQNLNGISRVATNVRAYSERNRRRAINMHFVVSNVPDLDDEDHILDGILARCKLQLGYDQLSAEIHHFSSLSLLDQEIFSITRPNSKLAREYKTLTNSLTRENLEDRNAVVQFLKKADNDFAKLTSDNDPDELYRKIESILVNFEHDGEICFLVALIYDQLGSHEDALALLTSVSVVRGFRTAHMFAVRSRLRERIGSVDESVDDLRNMLSSPGAEFETFIDSISRIEDLEPNLIGELPSSSALRSLPYHEQLFVANICDGGDIQLGAKISILKELIDKDSIEFKSLRGSAEHLLAMAYIARGEFFEALSFFDIDGIQTANQQISEVFNFAMIRWGIDGAPSLDIFVRVEELAKKSERDAQANPNYAQCIALTNALLGNVEKAELFLNYARTKIKARPRQEFSAWTYLRETPEVFLRHLDVIESILHGEMPSPDFMKAVKAAEKSS